MGPRPVRNPSVAPTGPVGAWPPRRARARPWRESADRSARAASGSLAASIAARLVTARRARSDGPCSPVRMPIAAVRRRPTPAASAQRRLDDPGARRFGETPVGDRAEADDREDADRPVDEDDRERLGRRHAVDERQDGRRRPSRRCRCPAGVSGTAVRSEPDSATKNAPLIPRWTSGKPSASTTRKRRIASVAQISPVITTSLGSGREPDRREDALLEPVVQLEDAVRQRQPR